MTNQITELTGLHILIYKINQLSWQVPRNAMLQTVCHVDIFSSISALNRFVMNYKSGTLTRQGSGNNKNVRLEINKKKTNQKNMDTQDIRKAICVLWHVITPVSNLVVHSRTR